MNSFIKDNRGIILKISIGTMILNTRFGDYCKTGFGVFIASFIISYIGILGRSYNIYKYPKLLRANNIFFFILGSFGVLASTSYMIFSHNALAVPDFFFGSCGAILATTLQTYNIDDRIPQKFIAEDEKKKLKQINQKWASKWFNLLCTFIALAIIIGAIFLIEWFYPDLLDIVRLN